MKIIQKIGFFSGTLTAEVKDDEVLVLTTKKLFNHYEQKFLLDDIDHRPNSIINMSLAGLITSISALAISIFLFWFGRTYRPPPDDGPFIFFSVILIFVSVVAGFKTIRSRFNVVYFNSKNGPRLFSLIGNKPSSKEVTEFCEQLSNRIEKIRYSGEISRERMSEIFKKHLLFLVENEVLMESEMDLAIRRIKERSAGSIVKLVIDGNT